MEELRPVNKRIPNYRHRSFIDEYFKCNMNATRAYMNVYDVDYESATASGPRLLGNVRIKEEIEYRLKDLAMSKDETLARLTAQAQGDLAEFAHIETREDLAKHPKSSIARKFKRKVWYDKDGEPHEEIELELYDAHAALVDIGKKHGIFSDNLTVKVEGELEKLLDTLQSTLDTDTYNKVVEALADD